MNPATKRKTVRALAGRDARAAARVADRIWEHAELGFREKASAAALAGFLENRGFEVDFCIRSVPTAFKATRGKGGPVVGILGEYDALPDCGLESGANGHGCGHNLLGAGAALGAVTTARLLEEKRRPGRVVFWGCPAEEFLAGKVYMARDGAFRGMDACLGWHPSGEAKTHAAGGSALESLVFAFSGVTAHGAHAEKGRSALDAAMLTDVAVNYLREHVPENVRIHCVITEGGKAPNVVPEHAKIWYYVRGRNRTEVDEIAARVVRCAKGAAMATETKAKVTRTTGVYERLRNDALAETVQKNLLLMGVTRPTEADRKRVKRLGKKPVFAPGVKTTISTVQGKGSSDEDNVSWLAPFGCFTMTCVSKGVTGHNRELTAQTNLPFAHRGVVRAGEVFAGIAWDLCTDAALLRKVKAEFKKRTKGFRYDPLIPRAQKPPVHGA